MRFVSTRAASPSLSLSSAIQAGLAPDGGLYLPDAFPRFELKDFDGLESLPAIAEKVLRPFVEGDRLEPYLSSICQEVFDFPVVLRDAGTDTAVLELFHGPTGAFKDVGARFLARCLVRTEGQRTVLVATSGDTGGAVAAAFHGDPKTEVVILFPKDRVSPRQQAQLACWGNNVKAFAVRGDFDECQRVVKEGLASPEWRGRRLLSANSINLGRLLPQTVYYAAAVLWYWRKHGEAPGFIVPTGNLGNAVACFWTREMGLPIREIVMATNANCSVPDYLDSGEWIPHSTISTLANAMDVGNPSNMERLRHLYPNSDELRAVARAFSISDQEIEKAIAEGIDRWGQIWCPHTATAVCVREKLPTPHWIIVSTAHPAKFESIVEPLIGGKVDIPESLAALLGKRQIVVEIEPSLEALGRALDWPAGSHN